MGDLRKYKRAKINCKILYPTILLENRRTTVYEDDCLTALDISESGIGLKSSFKIPQNTFLTFYLRIKDNLPFKVLIIVRWQREQDGYYICGGEFIALSLQDIYILRNYVESNK